MSEPFSIMRAAVCLPLPSSVANSGEDESALSVGRESEGRAYSLAVHGKNDSSGALGPRVSGVISHDRAQCEYGGLRGAEAAALVRLDDPLQALLDLGRNKTVRASTPGRKGPWSHRQEPRAGASDASDGASDAAGSVLALGELVHELARSGLIAGGMQDVGSQSNDVAVLRRIGGGFDRCNFPVEAFLSRLNQSPNNISVCGIRGSAAEAIEGLSGSR